MEDKIKNLDNKEDRKCGIEDKNRIKEFFISDKLKTPKQVRGFEDIKWNIIKQSRFQGFLRKIFRTKEQKYF